MPTTTPQISDSAESDSADQPGPSCHHVHISRKLRRGSLPAADSRWLQARLIACADELAVTLDDLGVVIIHDQQMSDLHLRFSGVEGTTDVLTFDLADEPDGKHIEGEIYICFDEAARQAASRGHDVRTELLLYVLHGVLHLMGYDDHDPADHAAMHAEEDRVLQAIGIGRVFGT